MNFNINQEYKKKYLKYKNKYLSYKNQLGGNKTITVFNKGNGQLICELQIDQDYKIKDLKDKIAHFYLPDIILVVFTKYEDDIDYKDLYDDNIKICDLEENTFYVYLHKVKQLEKPKINTVLKQEVISDISTKKYSDSDLLLYIKPYPNEMVDYENKVKVGNRAEFKNTGSEPDGIRGTVIKEYEDSYNHTRFIMKCDDGEIIDRPDYKFTLITKIP